MKYVSRAWYRLCRAVRWRHAPKEPRWIEPCNEITQAITAGLVGDLPRLRTEFRHRPVTLDDYPALAAALHDLATQPPRQQPPGPPAKPAPAAAVAPPPALARPERKTAISTRSARRRRHRHAA